MISAAFFFSIFTSIVWIFYSLANSSPSGLNDFAVKTIVVVLPIFILWAIFGYIYQYLSASVLNKNMYSLFKQLKKNQEATDVIARVLLEQKETSLDNLVLNKFDVFVSDMNELLAEIMKRGNLSSAGEIDDLWVKAKNGGRWAFGKTVIDLAQNRPNLPNSLLQIALTDTVLSGTILEFCSRYQSFVSALEKHDKERLFLNIIETGVFGKVFTLLAGPADSIRQNRDLILAHRQMDDTPELVEAPAPKPAPAPAPLIEDEQKPSGLSESARRLFVHTFTRKKTEEKPVLEDPTEEKKDPLSLAFEKSFGASQEEPQNEDSVVTLAHPVDERSNLSVHLVEAEEKDDISMPEIILNRDDDKKSPSFSEPKIESGFLSAKETLNDIRKELEATAQRSLSATKELDIESELQGMPEPKISNDSDFSYPFGGWMNAENYDK